MAAASSSAITLHNAARQGDVEAGRKILEGGTVKVNEVDKLQRTPLHLACWAGKLEFVQLLLDHRANVHAMAGDKFMPLHFAAQSGNPGICRLLLDRKAKVHARVAKSNKTPLLFAASKGHTEVVRVLLEYGANVTDRTIKQESVKDVATNEEIRELLDNAESIFKAAVEARRAAKALAMQGGEEGGEGSGKRAAEELEEEQEEEDQGEEDEGEDEPTTKKARKGAAPSKGPISVNFGDDDTEEFL